MAALLRHHYLVVLGSCCTADALRAKDFDDIAGSRLRLLSYQGRTSLLSMATPGLEAEEYGMKGEREDAQVINWGLTMAVDEAAKRQLDRLLKVVAMADAVVFDSVSGFGYPYLVVEPGGRLFIESEEWQRYIGLHASASRRWLWEMPLEQSLLALRRVMTPLYERQPALQLIFHFPRPCFNDGIAFAAPELARQVDFYFRYGEALYEEARRFLPRVSWVGCGGEVADPNHPNGAFPFHYGEAYMETLRRELERLLAEPQEATAGS